MGLNKFITNIDFERSDRPYMERYVKEQMPDVIEYQQAWSAPMNETVDVECIFADFYIVTGNRRFKFGFSKQAKKVLQPFIDCIRD